MEIKQYAVEKTILAFDIHGVITQKYIWPMLKTACYYPNKWKMICSCSSSMLCKTCSYLWNRDWNRMRKLFKDENRYLFDFMHQIADAQKPIKGTFKIIQKLKELACELHILSNISPSAYASFKEKFSYIFNLFDVEQISFWQEDSIIEKPNLEYFRRYLAIHNSKNKQIMFIDDQQININAAEKFGIIGIKFKNAGQLNDTLHKLGII